MPGIVGIIGLNQSPEASERLVAAMTRSLVHERFHTSGVQRFPELGIHAGWVAHEGSLAADQVFWNETRDVALLLAGECFCPPEVKVRLARSGHGLTDCPGGWLVHWYEERGAEFFGSLNGLFSGVLVDLRQRRAYLFNDRYGVERLYWHEADGVLYFASEAKALLEVLPGLRHFDENGVAQYLQYGCTRGTQTMFNGVQLAPGGSLWTITPGGWQQGRYFTPAEWESLPTLTLGDFEQAFNATFSRILPNYLEHAPRVGLSLTGGLDTRMILAALGKKRAHLTSYTFGGRSRETVDVSVARKVAGVCGLPHRVLPMGEDFFQRFGDYADRTVHYTDGCFGALGAHEIYFHEQARAMAPVRLTGNFGSEILRSMSTFKPLGLSAQLSALSVPAEDQVFKARHPVTFAAFEEVPWNLFGTLAAGRSQLTFRTPYLDNEVVALAFQAPSTARASHEPAMRHISGNDKSLAAIPTDRGAGGPEGLARVFRRAIAEFTCKLDYHYSEGLPRQLSFLDSPYAAMARALGIAGSHKFLQYRRWLQKDLAAFARERLAAAELPFWNVSHVRSMLNEHAAGRSNFSREINAVITLETVNRTILRRQWSK